MLNFNSSFSNDILLIIDADFQPELIQSLDNFGIDYENRIIDDNLISEYSLPTSARGVDRVVAVVDSAELELLTSGN